MEPTIAITALTKLIGLGIKGWNALENRTFDEKDVDAIRTMLETSTSLASMRKPVVAAAAAQHLALVARCFGQAVGRHQEFHGKVLLAGGLRRWLSRAERDRENEIELRVKAATLQLRALGDDPRGEVELVASLTGSPLGTAHYRKLWEAFSDPRFTLPDEEPPLVMSETARREFERYFLLKYLDGLQSPAGRGIAEYLDNLRAYRAVLVRDMLVEDMATWGGRHVFGNVPRERWVDGDSVPFIPLDALYVEPDGRAVGDHGNPQPLLALVERLTAPDSQPRVVVLVADFGSGKSLSARMLARRWSEQFLTTNSVSLDAVLPIYSRCAEDFPHEMVDLAATVRRAWKRQCDGFGLSISDEDDALAWPNERARAVFLLDGLDEVALGDQHIKTLFQKLQARTTKQHRFVVLSRPGALPTRKDLGEAVVMVRVQPFRRSQIKEWLRRWAMLRPERPTITPALIEKRSLDDIVCTPILLFMVAFTWEQHAFRQESPSLAEIYESFFLQIASGKADADGERHLPIGAASDALLAALKDASILEEGATLPDAMLWLMSRVAWEAQKLEQARPPVVLTRRHLDNILHEEDLRVTHDAEHIIRIGLLLTLQADLRTAEHPILFGHQSFREFLVGRYWATHLHGLVRGTERDWDNRTTRLLGGRLLGEENRSLDFLKQIINAPTDHDRPASPLTWTDQDREVLVRWAQEVFNDERQVFGRRRFARDEPQLRDDQRAVLREAALAIGSLTKNSPGLRSTNPLTLRSMLAWFWLHEARPHLVAPRSDHSQANLRGANLDAAALDRAVLDRAILDSAELAQARLSGASLRHASLFRTNLIGASLDGATLEGAILDHAILSGASLIGANLLGASLVDARLDGAKLVDARLDGARLDRADLVGANLNGACLMRATLANASLGGANLIGAELNGASLAGATYDSGTIWPPGYDPEAAVRGS